MEMFDIFILDGASVEAFMLTEMTENKYKLLKSFTVDDGEGKLISILASIFGLDSEISIKVRRINSSNYQFFVYFSCFQMFLFSYLIFS